MLWADPGKDTMTNRFDLQQFLDAPAPIYPVVLGELRAGRKQSHWMWFIFPQLAGLGHSAMAQRFAISSRDEAVAYLSHAVLGFRLRECTALVINAVEGHSIWKILRSPDDLKFHSSMTLFGAASSDPKFSVAIAKFYAGTPDQRTFWADMRPTGRLTECQKNARNGHTVQLISPAQR
jgi:uncharacterized protein (DUF1810 family)